MNGGGELEGVYGGGDTMRFTGYGLLITRETIGWKLSWFG